MIRIALLIISVKAAAAALDYSHLSQENFQLFAKELEVFFLLSEVRYVNPLDSFERLIKHLVLIFTTFHFEYSYL